MPPNSIISITACLLAVSSTLGAQSPGFSLVPVRELTAAKVRATGHVVPKWSAEVGARTSGRILAWGKSDDGSFLDRGSHVEAGRELFRLDPAPLEAKAAIARAALAVARARAADLRAGTRAERIQAGEAAVAELDAKLADLHRDEVRFRRLVEDDRTMPAKKLEDVRMQIEMTEASRRAASARLGESRTGPTPTELAIADATVAEMEAHLQAAEIERADTIVRSPFKGVITRRMRSPGDHVNSAPFVAVLELVSDEDIEAELRLPESTFRDVRSGETRAIIRSPLNESDLDLAVTRVVSAIDPADGVFLLRIAIPPTLRGHLVPGAFLQAEVITGSKGGVIVPAGALVVEGSKSFVFIARDGVLRRTEVTAGDRMSDSVVVSGAISPTDRVAIGPTAALRDGAVVPTSKPD